MITINQIQQFQLFCMESYKVEKKITGKRALKDFEKKDVFNFLEIGYEVLHTQGKQYLVAEIIDFINR